MSEVRDESRPETGLEYAERCIASTRARGLATGTLRDFLTSLASTYVLVRDGTWRADKSVEDWLHDSTVVLAAIVSASPDPVTKDARYEEVLQGAAKVARDLPLWGLPRNAKNAAHVAGAEWAARWIVGDEVYDALSAGAVGEGSHEAREAFREKQQEAIAAILSSPKPSETVTSGERAEAHRLLDAFLIDARTCTCERWPNCACGRAHYEFQEAVRSATKRTAARGTK